MTKRADWLEAEDVVNLLAEMELDVEDLERICVRSGMEYGKVAQLKELLGMKYFNDFMEDCGRDWIELEDGGEVRLDDYFDGADEQVLADVFDCSWLGSSAQDAADLYREYHQNLYGERYEDRFQGGKKGEAK